MKAKNVMVLVGKDLRMSKWVLAMAVGIWALPMLLGAVVVMVRTICYDKPLQPAIILGLGSWSFYLTFLVIPTVVGYVLTAEGTDRSAGFLAYMPFSRLESLAGKVISAAMMTTLFIGLNAILVSIPFVLELSSNPPDVPTVMGFLAVFLSAMVAIFGITWAAAICARSAAIAVAVGLAIPHSLYVYQIAYYGDDLLDPRSMFIPWSLVLGVVCFIVGAVVFLKRRPEA